MAKVSVIGGGFSGLSAAAFAAKAGHEVFLLEKNPSIGGRARKFDNSGFLFDMGPSWYWMPDTFENFFNSFGKSTTDFYELKLLDPGFQMFFGNGEIVPVPAKEEELDDLFESLEKGSSRKLKKFLKEGELKYKVGMQNLVYKPALSWTEFANYEVLNGAMKTHIFKSMRKYVRSYFKDPRLIALMEFPVLFLGAKPENIPALYSLMNYAALKLGTHYPMGGMYGLVDAMRSVAESQGVQIKTNVTVEKILVNNKKVYALDTSQGSIASDLIIASGDYHHIENDLLTEKHRNYKKSYWDGKILAPSSLIFYLGVSKKIKKLIHHNLFFDKNFDKHSSEIYDNPIWPEDPLFYVCCPSKTDKSVAPEGMENLFILIPIAPGLEDSESLHEQYYNKVIGRLEAECQESIRDFVVYKRSYCINDFKNDYNAFKGNAYGLANTLSQTAILKPSLKNKRLDNLFYAGQLTVPGPGVPPALISGEISAKLAINYLKHNYNEANI